MAIDYKDAHNRIVRAFAAGIIRAYGERRIVKQTFKTMRPGPVYFDKAEKWVDPKGVPRVGRFKRMPGKEIEVTQDIPQGVVPEEILGYAEAVSIAFLEVLRICEENGLGARVGTMTELAAEVAERLGGKGAA